VCHGGLEKDLVESAFLGGVGPVVESPKGIIPITVPPTTLVKNLEGNPEALPSPPRDGLKMRVERHRMEVEKTSIAPRKIWADKNTSGPNKVSRASAASRGPVCVGPCAPPVPVVTAGDRDSCRATVNGRLTPYMADPKAGAWADVWEWTVRNWDFLFGGVRPFRPPFRLPQPRTTRGADFMRRWANSFSPRAKAQKKLRGVASYLANGVTEKDQVLKGMRKVELLQGSAKSFRRPAPIPAVQVAPTANLTGQSGLACQRCLRYYDTAVVDALFGPHCTVAYKALSKTWSGNHPVRQASGRCNEDVGRFFEALEDPESQDHISRDFTLFDNSHGPEAHAFFFNVMARAGFFRSEDHETTWANLFPQTVNWSGVGRFVVAKGMASGAVWTTLMNTLINGVLTLYSLHKAWAEAKRLVSWHGTLSAFLSDTNYRAAHAGDDGVVIGRRLKCHEARAVKVISELGYSVKTEFSTDFLGCSPIPCLRKVSAIGEPPRWEEAYCMVPVPHRFLTTLGWALERPTHPAAHCAGVGLGWLGALSHIPGYGPLLAGMASCNKSRVSFSPGESAQLLTLGRQDALARANFTRGWAEYSPSLATKWNWAVGPRTVSALCQAWHISAQTLAAFHSDMLSIPSFPCYIGTAAVHEVMSSSLGT
jgi:hypothetical protein